jgi:peptide/nickel transport system permease protein
MTAVTAPAASARPAAPPAAPPAADERSVVVPPLDERPVASRTLARRLGRVVLRNVTTAVPVLLITSLVTFALGALGDQDPAAAMVGEAATEADVARMERTLGLDDPWWVQYAAWVGRAATGDLGSSWFTHVPVAQSIAERLPVSLSVAGLALVIAVVAGTSAGIGAALHRGRLLDRAVTAIAAVLSTVPAFAAGIGLVVVFAVILRVLPAGGYVPPELGVGPWLATLTLPALALSLDAAADIARQLRTGLVDALDQNYVTGARVRGLPGGRVVLGHALRNGAAPAVAVIGLHVPRLIGGAVITEAVFLLPGIGQLTRDAALRGDVPVIQGALLVTVVVVLISSLVVDVVQARLLPASAGAR